MNAIATACSILMAVVLAWAAVAKLSTPLASRRAALERFRLVPRKAILPVAVSLPFLELAAAFFLLIPRLWMPVHIGLGLMFGVFTTIVLREIIAGRSLECGCFGEARGSPPRVFLLRNLGLILICGVGATYAPARLPMVDALFGAFLAPIWLLSSVLAKHLVSGDLQGHRQS